MAEITINGVKYTNVPNKKAGTKFAASLTQSNIGASQAVQDYVNSAYFYPLVNAIDINWNGVEVEENSYINTTSDLISYIASKESNVDLSSYATMTYVDQKITDLIGGAPETLDTLKELADALEDEASLAYVTQALDGKADKSSLTNYATNSYVTTELDKKADKSQLPDMNNYSTVSYVTTELDKKANKSEIPSMPDLTPYVTYTQANSYYAGKNEIPDLSSYATTSYVTTELDKKANKSEIPSMPDLTPYVSYEQANSYYAYKSDIPDMTNYVSVSSYNALAARVEELASWIVSYHTPTPEPITGEFGFQWGDLRMNVGDVLTPPLTNTYTYDSITYISDNQSVFTVDQSGACTGIGNGNANLTAQLYNNTTGEYITETSIPVIVGGGGSGYDFNFDDEYIDMNIGDTVTPSITNTSEYTNISYTSSDSSVVSVDANGTCTALTLGQATISATLYDNNNNEQAFSSVQLNVSKQYPMPTGWTYDGQIVSGEWTFVIGDSTSTPITYAFTATPSDGWEFATTMYQPINGVSIDSTTYNITITPSLLDTAGEWNMHVERQEDSQYYRGEQNMPLVVLAAGTDPTFNFHTTEMYISNEEGTTTKQLYDSTGEIGMYTPTVTSSDTSIVTATVDPNMNNNIIITFVNEGDATVTATITNPTTSVTRTATLTVHATVNRDWVDGHVYTSQNNEVNDLYGVVKNGSNPSLTFTTSNGNTQDPVTGFEVTITNDTYNIVSYTSTSNGVTISFDNNALASASVGDEINLNISRAQDSTYSSFNKDMRFKVVPAGSDPLLWWENGAIFAVTENDVFSQDPITGWLSNQFLDFSTWQTLPATLSITNGTGAAHLDQDNVLHGDNAGSCTLTATVTDLNNNTHTGHAIINVESAS